MTEVAEAAAASSASPAYLAGHLAPVPDEIEARDLEVTGALPRELAGRYLRNGPNPLPGENPGHWFAGHGMVHGIRIRNGHAEWYRNRWVRTDLFEGHRTGTTRQRSATPANTHVVEHSGWLLSIVSDRSGKGSDLVVLDASDPTAAPVATVHLPRRVPTGFHGSWIPDAELDA